LVVSSFSDESFETAYRDGDLEVNVYRGSYVVYRVYSGRRIYVYSAPAGREDAVKPLVEKALAREADAEPPLSDLYSGEYRSGKPADLDKAVELVRAIGERFESYGLRIEAVAVSKHTVVEHTVPDYGVSAREERWVHELYIYPYTLYMGRLLSTGRLLASTSIEKHFEDLDAVVKTTAKRIELQSRARSFNPVNIGRWRVVLLGDAACALYHEIAHMLQADEPVKLPLESVIGAGVKVVEDPFHPGPLQRVFDDELYPAWRRTLVEDGVVVDYLRTRLTSESSKPGNARGLFTRPKPLHHQLVVKPGDWSVDEALEEFKKVLVVEDILKAELGRGYIEIAPEHALMYESDKWTPVVNLTVRIPVTQLSRVLIGLTREVSARYSFEKSMPVYEVAPGTIVEARVVV